MFDLRVKPKKQQQPIMSLIGTREPVYVCHWTGAYVKSKDVVWTGPVVPGVKFKHAAAPGYEDARKESVRSFNESEANCNTCKHLTRIKHEKCRFGFLQGTCNKKGDGSVMKFHADDWMGMECYEARL
jgi:hypothetical protein